MIKYYRNPFKFEYLCSYLLYEPNYALHVFTVAPEFQFHISYPRGKIVQNVKFLSVNQNSDLSSKLNVTRQHDSRSMLSFQNRAPKYKVIEI